MGGVNCCYRTVPDGQAVAVYESAGEVHVVRGPTRICNLGLCGREFRDLAHVAATESEYLEVKYRDGRSELRAGPAGEWQHPVEHEYVRCRDALQIGDQELIVVYRKNDKGEVVRHLVRGPMLYIPETSGEWTHEFCWTGPDPGADSMLKASKKVGALVFTKLRTIPAKMYYDVEHVRTKDNAVVTVKVMIFYQLSNVEKMMDNTNDPMGDFVNSISADVIEWCAPKKFDEFLMATDQLNTMAPYAQLVAGGAKIGYKIDRVVFRGYSAPNALQTMHDRAIEKRTALTLQKETEAEEQNLADFKLSKEAQRVSEQHKLEMEKLNHDLLLKRKVAESARELKEMENRTELERLDNIKKLDKKGEMAMYLIAKDCQLPPTINCATMLAGGTTSGGSNLPSLPGLKW